VVESCGPSGSQDLAFFGPRESGTRSCNDRDVTVVAGVDACRGGLIAIVLEDGRFTDALFASGFVRLLDGLARAATVGVDIPIGLPEEGPRAADLAARAFVGPRRGSIAACLSRDANRKTRRGGASWVHPKRWSRLTSIRPPKLAPSVGLTSLSSARTMSHNACRRSVRNRDGLPYPWASSRARGRW
jgi:Protein of unknown function (DUF429)